MLKYNKYNFRVTETGGSNDGHKAPIMAKLVATDTGDAVADQ
jgi:hypothetical protein